MGAGTGRRMPVAAREASPAHAHPCAAPDRTAVHATLQFDLQLTWPVVDGTGERHERTKSIL